jgi:hypothetical protein
VRIALGPAGLVGAGALVFGMWRRRLVPALIGAALVAHDLKRRSSR